MQALKMDGIPRSEAVRLVVDMLAGSGEKAGSAVARKGKGKGGGREGPEKGGRDAGSLGKSAVYKIALDMQEGWAGQ